MRIQSVAYAEFVKILSFIRIILITLYSRLNMFEAVCIQNFLNNCVPYQLATQKEKRRLMIVHWESSNLLLKKLFVENESNLGFSCELISCYLKTTNSGTPMPLYHKVCPKIFMQHILTILMKIHIPV